MLVEPNMEKLVALYFTLQVYAVFTEAGAQCGVPDIPPLLDPQDRIYGGTAAIPGSWPWQAGLYTHNYLHFCGGALINERYVITAAHCLWSKPLKNIRVHLGSHTRRAMDDTEVAYKVEEVCTHPRFNPNNTHMPDIAIVKLRQNVTFKSTISPVCLPKHREELLLGSKYYVTGWGATTRSKKVTKSPELKQALTEEVPRTSCPYSSAGFICARHTSGVSCPGDSGGPVVHQRNETWTLFGLVSSGPRICGDIMQAPLLFSKVSHYINNFILPYIDPKTPRNVIRRICTVT